MPRRPGFPRHRIWECWFVTPVVLCRTRQRAEQACERVAAILAPLGLRLHPEKTRLASLALGTGGFHFLGSTTTWWNPGGGKVATTSTSGRRPEPWPSIRSKVRDEQIGASPAPRRTWSSTTSTPCCGWGNYFRHANSNRKFNAVDSYVHQRMARLASIKHGLRGIN